MTPSAPPSAAAAGTSAPAAALPQSVGILGTGLVGGSLLLALRRLLPRAELRAGAPSAKTRDAVRASGAADAVFDPSAVPPEEALRGCDVVFMAAPPEAVCRDLPRMARAGAGIVADVCSVKGAVLDAARGLRNFVGGHPMAGTEGVGFGAADPDLFQGAAFILCVPPDFSAGARRLASFRALVEALGMRVFEMDAASHDRRLAMISHLPHAAAFALAGEAARERDPLLAKLVGGGFRDTTRIAASSPALWTDILRSSPALPAALDAYLAALSRLRAALDPAAPPSELRTLLEEAETYRRGSPEGLHRVPHA